MTPPQTGSQDTPHFFKRAEVPNTPVSTVQLPQLPGEHGPVQGRAVSPLAPRAPASPRPAAVRGCPRTLPPVGVPRRGSVATPHATVWTRPFAAAPRARPGLLRVPQTLVPGRPAGAHLWYCAWRNWNSSLMRSSDSGMVNLKGWPAAWCGVWRGGGTGERCMFRHCTASPRAKGGGAVQSGRARGMERVPGPARPRPGALRTCYPPSRPSSAVGPRLTALRLPPTRSCHRRLHESGKCRLLPADPRRGGTAGPIPGAAFGGCCLARRRLLAVLPKASKLPTQQKYWGPLRQAG